tara:strand:+ start:337 stop:1353 length:1017 start_codon:yes stop_codon:yes gene_type:complete
MKDDTVVVHLTKCADKTTIASAKIAKFISDEYELPLVDGPGQFKKQYRNIIYVNSMGAFAHPDLRRELAEQARHCDRLIYVQNDYNVHPISQVQKVVRDERGWSHDFPFTKGEIFLWGTVPEFVFKPGDLYLNWNQLTYTPSPRREPHSGPYSGSVFYWGACRPGRKDAFARLLFGCYGHANFPVVISCATKVRNKFAEIPESYTGLQHERPTEVSFVRPFKSIEELQQYGCTIYMEDEASNDLYTSPANRFYEALSADLFMFVDDIAAHTLKRAGYEVPPEWIISTPADIKKVGLPVPVAHRNKQAMLWRYKAEEGLEELKQKGAQAVWGLRKKLKK